MAGTPRRSAKYSYRETGLAPLITRFSDMLARLSHAGHPQSSGQNKSTPLVRQSPHQPRLQLAGIHGSAGVNATRKAPGTPERPRLAAVPCRNAGEYLAIDYQPIFDTQLGKPIAMEALPHWNFPARGKTGVPGPIADAKDEPGQIGAITASVIRRAIEECPVWHHGADLFIKIGSRDFLSRRNLQELMQVIQICAAPLEKIVFELGETTGIDFAQAGRNITELHNAGLRFAISDVGSCNAGFRQIAQLPIDFIQIDARLISNISENPATRDSIRALLDQARSMPVDCIAKGIATPQQALNASLLGIRYMQGDHFTRPGRAADISSVLWAQNAKPANREIC